MTESHAISLNKKIWRICEKLRDVIFDKNVNILEYFKRNDNGNTGFLSEALFANVLSRQIPDIDLCDSEIAELTDHFRQEDSRIDYVQLCGMVGDNSDIFSADNVVTGLEWEDPSHVNHLTASELRHLDILLTHIALKVRRRDLIVWPHFRNYEFESKNAGTITFGHFARICKFLQLKLSRKEFDLLVKRFGKDRYTVCYTSFLKVLDEYRQQLSDQNEDLRDFSADDKTLLPDCVRVHLRRPRRQSEDLAKNIVGDTNWSEFDQECVANTLARIKRHTETNGIATREYFTDFDRLRCGLITRAQFLRALGRIGLFGHRRIHIADFELDLLCDKYADQIDPNRINYVAFDNDLVEAKPQVCKSRVQFIESTKKPIFESNCEPSRLSLCEEVLFHIRARIDQRRLDVMPFLKSFDKFNSGHVTHTQFHRVLATNGILVEPDGMTALQERYGDDIGFNYELFMSEAQPPPIALNEPESVPPLKPSVRIDIDRNQLFAKIKKIITQKQIQLAPFLSCFDVHNERCITKSQFLRGIDAAGIALSSHEIVYICEQFKAKLPEKDGCIDYKHFCQVFDAAENRPPLEHYPLLEPIQYLPSEDGMQNFLNFEERLLIANALKMLTDHCDSVSGLGALFADFDARRCGSVSQDQVRRALTTYNLNKLISSREYEALLKCFGVERGLRLEFNYRAFLRSLELLYAIK